MDEVRKMTRDWTEQISSMSVSTSSTIREALYAIDRGALGTVLLVDPVTDRFSGLVTDGDIRRALLKGQGLETPVLSVARPEPKIAHEGMTPEEIAGLFSETVRVVPIVDSEGRVVDLAVFDKRVYLPVAEPSFGTKELLYVTEAVVTGWVSSAGAFVTRFEEMFAEFCGVKYAVSTSNGTTALHLALLALGIGPGDEVIVPTLTFIATANAVTYTGATPVFVDSESLSWNIDPERIEAAITPRTKAIIPVHLYGHPANMDPILDIAKRHSLWIVEDAAEAHGAKYKGRIVGSIGDIGCFSFYGNKIVTTGEGGMLTTDDSALAEKARILRDHGMSKEKRYWHDSIGYNYRLTNLQAAIGVAQMERVDEILDRKRKVADGYDRLLQDVPGLVLPPHAEWAEPVCWLYSLLVDDEICPKTRDAIIEGLQAAGVDSRPFFYPITDMPPYQKHGGRSFSAPVAQRLSRQGLSLPSSVNLTDIDIAAIAESLASTVSS